MYLFDIFIQSSFLGHTVHLYLTLLAFCKFFLYSKISFDFFWQWETNTHKMNNIKYHIKEWEVFITDVGNMKSN